jgi:hypothetical protein
VSAVTPSSAEIRRQTDRYVSDALTLIQTSLTTVKASTAFLEIFHISLSADVVLAALDTPKLRPRLVSARSIVLRLPLLVAAGQESVAIVELRRFVELLLWTIYFTDHPIEWHEFKTSTGGGFVADFRKPIAYAAHRELSHYVEYARELMSGDPSGLALTAVDELKQASDKLNSAIHAGGLATSNRRNPPADDVSEQSLRKAATLQRKVFGNCCLLLAAYRTPRFNTLTASGRAHFDWLVGATMRRQVRSGPFGLPERS